MHRQVGDSAQALKHMVGFQDFHHNIGDIGEVGASCFFPLTGETMTSCRWGKTVGGALRSALFEGKGEFLFSLSSVAMYFGDNLFQGYLLIALRRTGSDLR